MREEYRMVDYVQRTMPGQRLPWKIVRPLSERWIDRLAHNLSSRKYSYEPDLAIRNGFMRSWIVAIMT